MTWKNLQDTPLSTKEQKEYATSAEYATSSVIKGGMDNKAIYICSYALMVAVLGYYYSLLVP